MIKEKGFAEHLGRDYEFVGKEGYNYGATDYLIHEGESCFEVELIKGF